VALTKNDSHNNPSPKSKYTLFECAYTEHVRTAYAVTSPYERRRRYDIE
jgi:hypothetical protein